jgi:uncharacterized membrane protein YdjX (TVP38/TMEM64 family)
MGVNTQDRSRKRRQWWLVAAVLILLLSILAKTEWRAALGQAFSLDSIPSLAAYVKGFGLWAPVISIILMLLQSVIAPLPAWLVAGANGILFGIWWGTLISWTGGLLGAAVTFWLARWLGRDFVAKRVGAGRLKQVDELSGAHGFWLILIARLIPIVSFDLISYLAGLSRIGFFRFLLATAIGMTPGAFAFTVFGHDLMQARTYSWRLSLLGLVGVVAYLAGRWWRRRLSMNGETEAEEARK